MGAGNRSLVSAKESSSCSFSPDSLTDVCAGKAKEAAKPKSGSIQIASSSHTNNVQEFSVVDKVSPKKLFSTVLIELENEAKPAASKIKSACKVFASGEKTLARKSMSAGVLQTKNLQITGHKQKLISHCLKPKRAEPKKSATNDDTVIDTREPFCAFRKNKRSPTDRTKKSDVKVPATSNPVEKYVTEIEVFMPRVSVKRNCILPGWSKTPIIRKRLVVDGVDKLKADLPDKVVDKPTKRTSSGKEKSRKPVTKKLSMVVEDDPLESGSLATGQRMDKVLGELRSSQDCDKCLPTRDIREVLGSSIDDLKQRLETMLPKPKKERIEVYFDSNRAPRSKHSLLKDAPGTTGKSRREKKKAGEVAVNPDKQSPTLKKRKPKKTREPVLPSQKAVRDLDQKIHKRTSDVEQLSPHQNHRPRLERTPPQRETFPENDSVRPNYSHLPSNSLHHNDSDRHNHSRLQSNSHHESVRPNHSHLQISGLHQNDNDSYNHSCFQGNSLHHNDSRRKNYIRIQIESLHQKGTHQQNDLLQQKDGHRQTCSLLECNSPRKKLSLQQKDTLQQKDALQQKKVLQHKDVPQHKDVLQEKAVLRNDVLQQKKGHNEDVMSRRINKSPKSKKHRLRHRKKHTHRSKERPQNNNQTEQQSKCELTNQNRDASESCKRASPQQKSSNASIVSKRERKKRVRELTVANRFHNSISGRDVTPKRVEAAESWTMTELDEVRSRSKDKPFKSGKDKTYRQLLMEERSYRGGKSALEVPRDRTGGWKCDVDDERQRPQTDTFKINVHPPTAVVDDKLSIDTWLERSRYFQERHKALTKAKRQCTERKTDVRRKQKIMDSSPQSQLERKTVMLQLPPIGSRS